MSRPGASRRVMRPSLHGDGPAGGWLRPGLFFCQTLSASEPNSRALARVRAPAHGYPDPSGTSGARRGVQCPRPGHSAGDPGRPGLAVSDFTFCCVDLKATD